MRTLCAKSKLGMLTMLTIVFLLSACAPLSRDNPELLADEANALLLQYLRTRPNCGVGDRQYYFNIQGNSQELGPRPD